MIFAGGSAIIDVTLPEENPPRRFAGLLPLKAGQCVAIGASGKRGLEDIRLLLSLLPYPLAASFLVVLHRPFDQVSHLRDVLARSTPMPVTIAEEGETLMLGACYIGEPACHLTLLGQSTASMIPDSLHQFRNRTIDILFYSVARYAGARAIGVVLSGALDDGARGLSAIHAAGGVTMVVAPRATGEIGMPENAIGFDGHVDVIGSPVRIAHEISRLALPSLIDL